MKHWLQYECSQRETSAGKHTGDFFYSSLSFEPRIRNVSKNTFHHLKKTAGATVSLSSQYRDLSAYFYHLQALLLQHSAFWSALRGANLNSAAWMLTETRKRDHVTQILKSLHWLPVSSKIKNIAVWPHFKLIFYPVEPPEHQGHLDLLFYPKPELKLPVIHLFFLFSYFGQQ